MEVDHRKPPTIGEKYIRTRIKAGKVTVEAFGFAGESCQLATRALEERLGAVQKRELKDGEAGQFQTTN